MSNSRDTGLRRLKVSNHHLLIFGSLKITDATFLPGHSAAIKINIGGKHHTIGVFGILHPDVLRKERFDLGYPVSTLEINLEVFL